MARLTQGDIHALLGVLGNIYQMRNLEAFRREIVRALPGLIRSEITSYNEVDVRAGRDIGIAEPDDGVAERRRHAFDVHIHQHPLIRQYSETGDGHALKISDLLSSR